MVSAVVMITNGSGAPIVIVRDCVRVCFVGLESCAATVKVKLPCEVGVPEITPELDWRVSPGGREPEAKLQT